jgi:hypothetical protein
VWQALGDKVFGCLVVWCLVVWCLKVACLLFGCFVAGVWRRIGLRFHGFRYTRILVLKETGSQSTYQLKIAQSLLWGYVMPVSRAGGQAFSRTRDFSAFN